MSSSEGDHSRQMEEKLSHIERELEHLRDEVREIWKRLTAAEKILERLSQGEGRPSC